MATYYVDLENGNDSNNGTTFALRKKNLSAVTATAGDEIRVMASAPATSLGQNATWNNKKITSVSIANSSNTSPINITTSAAHGLSTGDTVCINGHTTNSNANGTWTVTVTSSTTFSLNTSVGTATGGATGTVFDITGRTVTLASAVTQDITSVGGSGVGGGNRTAWTGVTNVTVTMQSGTSKESSISDQFAINSTFTTGKIAHKQLPSTLDLSGYQQVSFWITQTTGTLASAGNLKLRLCSDTSGNTPVNTVDVPAMTATNFWYPVTVDLGTNLGSTINSVSLALTTDQGAQTFRICNIMACKAASADDSLTLTSLIGKDDGVWYSIQSISGTRVILDQQSGSLPTTTVNSQRNYCGVTETVETFKKETIKITTALSNTSAGSSGNPVTISGGWDRTDMSTQVDETIVDGLYRSNLYSMGSTANYQDVSGFGLVKGNNSHGLTVSGTTGSVVDINFINACTGNAVEITGSTNNCTVTVANIEFNGGFGLSAISTIAGVGNNTYGFDKVAGIIQDGIRIAESGSTVFQCLVIDNCNNGMNLYGTNTTVATVNEIKNCITSGITFGSGSNYYNNIRIENVGAVTDNGSYAFTAAGQGTVYVANGSTSGHTTYTVLKFGTVPIYFRNVDFGESQSIWFQRSGVNADCKGYFQNNNGVDYIYSDGGYVQSDTTTTQSGSGKSWALKPTATNRNAQYPVRLAIGRAAVTANNLVTVSAWVRRDNTNINGRLQVAGGQIAGVDTTSADITASADTWEEITITFTPTEAGVIEIEYLAWGGTTYTSWVDNVSITQA